MGYQSDLPKPLQTVFNKHNDSYSVDDLKPEILLVSTIISDFLITADWSDLDLKALNRRELIGLIEMKRRLIDTRCKLVLAQEKLEFSKSMAKAISREDFEKVVSEIVQFLSRETDTALFSKLSNYVSSMVAIVREQE